MRWLNTLVALFLGGIVGGALALNYQWPVVTSVIAGMVVGGLSYNPQEVLAAIRMAVREVWGVDYLFFLKWFARSFGYFVIGVAWFATILVAVGVSATSGLAYLELINRLFGGSKELPGMTLILAAVCLVVLAMVGATAPPKKFRNYIFNHISGLPISIGAFITLGVPYGLWMLMTRYIPRAIMSIPTVFFRFVELVSTHERLTVMASTATGVLIGVPLKSVLLCGFASVGVGATAVAVARKYLVPARRHRIAAQKV